MTVSELILHQALCVWFDATGIVHRELFALDLLTVQPEV